MASYNHYIVCDHYFVKVAQLGVALGTVICSQHIARAITSKMSQI